MALDRYRNAMRNKASVVRIVLASGIVEVYDRAVAAYTVKEKYPGLCLTRPEVFTRPQDSLVGNKDTLVPGQKYYLVPETTVRKLRQSFQAKAQELERDGETEREYIICCAKDFYVSKDKWNLCFQRRFMKEGEKLERPFRPPIKKMRMRQGLLAGWRPSLPTVVELSP